MLCILFPLTRTQEFLLYLDSFSFYYSHDLKGELSDPAGGGTAVSSRSYCQQGTQAGAVPRETHDGSSKDRVCTPATSSFPLGPGRLRSPGLARSLWVLSCAWPTVIVTYVCGGDKPDAGTTVLCFAPFCPFSVGAMALPRGEN